MSQTAGNSPTAILPFEDRVLIAILTRMRKDHPDAEYRENASKAMHSARLIALGRIGEPEQ